jgi:hypothetical protein
MSDFSAFCTMVCAVSGLGPEGIPVDPPDGLWRCGIREPRGSTWPMPLRAGDTIRCEYLTSTFEFVRGDDPIYVQAWGMPFDQNNFSNLCTIIAACCGLSVKDIVSDPAPMDIWICTLKAMHP